MKYTTRQIVSATRIDTDSKLSYIGIFELIQNNLTELMAKLKIDGNSTLKKYNAFWVYTKNRVKFLSNANWLDNIIIESFISSISLIKITIDTSIKNEHDEILAYSKVELCPINVNENKIQKVLDVGIDNSFEIHSPQLELNFEKYSSTELELKKQLKIEYSNIDFCKHTNNIEYIKFILNTFSCRELSKSPITEIQIDYLNQSFENDTISIFKSNQNPNIFEIKKEDQLLIKCKLLRKGELNNEKKENYD